MHRQMPSIQRIWSGPGWFGTGRSVLQNPGLQTYPYGRPGYKRGFWQSGLHGAGAKVALRGRHRRRRHQRGTCCTRNRRQTIEGSDDIFAVYEESFAEYCGPPDPEDAPKSLRGSTKKKVREKLAKIYGRRCFECGKRRKLTLDHIQPQSRGGTWLTTNVQPFCHECQRKKANLRPENVVVALDMLLRPPPSDSISSATTTFSGR